MKIICPNSCTIERCPHRLEHERSDCASLPKHCRTAVCAPAMKQTEMFQSSLPPLSPGRSLKSILEDELNRLGMGVRQ